MSYNSKLEILPEHYHDTKQSILRNGSLLWEQTHGNRINIYADKELAGVMSPNNYLQLTGISSKQFYSFLGNFTRNLYGQIKNNTDLLGLVIEFDGVSRDKNYESWDKLKSRTIFYNVDLKSAYWQIAHKLGYISTKFFLNYIDKDEYKEAKRYCISFLARDNEMKYYDGREIDVVTCNTDCLFQIYENIRYELYKCIAEAMSVTENWVEYNIDGITVVKKDLQKICKELDKMNLLYKVNECVKIDKEEFVIKGNIRKF